ncbi:L,D-transpeptidase [Candidatus Kaiserbacteria bacterium]|nr:L,D-transpeptidase [Candidatus Kaiserbacteria bacterium]
MELMRTIRFSPLSAGAILAVALASLVWLFLPTEAGPSDGPDVSATPQIVVQAHAEVVPPSPLYEYVEIEMGCNYAYAGECVYSRAGPGEEYKIVNRLRKGIVLKVEGAALDELHLWYKVVFDEPLRYPERVVWNQYVAASDVRHFYADGVRELDLPAQAGGQASTTKRIIVDRSEQKLYAYEDEQLFIEVLISTGIELTPTPRGNFTVYKKTPTRYMQGPLPGISEKYYDLPGVPWNLYFTNEGGVIHGAYWHNSFSRRWSNGCVNLPLAEARTLYEWADIGTQVLVRD